MLSHTQHVQHTQAKRAAQLHAIRAQYLEREAAENALRQERNARRERIEQLRLAREAERETALRAKMLTACGNTGLILDEVLSLRPCRRIDFVKHALQKYWDEDIPVTAQMALDAGCTSTDVKWVMYKLKKYTTPEVFREAFQNVNITDCLT